MDKMSRLTMDLQELLLSTNSLLLVAIAIILMVISYLVQTKAQKTAFRKRAIAWLPALDRGRRTSTSTTPPRSLTPEKKISNNVPAPIAYKDIFPPSTRVNLPIWAKSWTSLYAGFQSQPESGEVNGRLSSDTVIPFETDYRVCQPDKYTPTGLSLAEVKALGDFPDYATLSGVPLPEKYTGFEIETATPRPYRPFRWAYHQTMCKYSHFMP